MGVIKEQNKWEESVYLIEENDPVHGGENGVSNKAAKQLANRTKYLNETKAPIKNPEFTGTVKADYRLVVERIAEQYNPYTMLVNAAIEQTQPISASRLIGEYNTYTLANGEYAMRSSLRTGILTDGEVWSELRLRTLDNTNKVLWQSYSKTNNTVFGKTTDDGINRVQINGTATVTAPATNANNTQIPTTAWVRAFVAAKTTLADYGITDWVVKNLTTENLNDIRIAGAYGQAANANATTARNYPITKAGSLIVKPSAYGCQQEYIAFDTLQRYVRNTLTNNQWGAWKRADGAEWSEVRNVPNATISQKGVVQLTNDTGLDSEALALTAKAGKALAQAAAAAQQTAAGKWTAVDATTARKGIVQLNNTLTSTSNAQALTAAQGKALKESIDTKAPIHNPSFTGTVSGGYRLVIDRNEAEYTPYIHLKDRSVDISQTLSKDKVVAQYLGVVKNGDGEQRVSYVHTVMRQDKNAELLLGAVGANKVNRWGIDVFGKTGNVAIGKTSDDGTNRLQVNGTATVTAPTATANNTQVPTTKWVRDTAILQDGVGQQISGSLQINSKTGWSGIWLGTKNGSWRLEGNPDDNDKRVNLVHKDQDGGQLYIRFPTITKDERVAYQSWVTEQAKSFVKKSGDTMTGTLIVPRIEVTSNNQGGNNIKIGDDAYIGDDQVAHTVKVRSATNNNVGFIAFGNSGARLGRGLNYNESILEWEGNYLSLNVKNDEYTGIDFLRNKSGQKYWSRFESLPDKRFKLIVEDSYEQFTQTKSGTLALLSDCTPELVTLFKGEFHSASHRTNITTGSVNGAVITLAQSFKNFRYLVAVVSNDEKTFYHQNISMTSLIPVGNSTAATFDLGGAGALFWFGRFLSNTQIQCINENCVLHAIYGTNAL